MAERGRPVHSFNLAASGAGNHELTFILEELQAIAPSGVRLLLVEVTYHNGDLLGPPYSARAISWHSLASLPSVFDTLRSSRGAVAARVAVGITQVRQTAARYVNLGIGPELLLRLRDEPPAAFQREVDRVALSQGFEATDGRSNYERRRKGFLSRGAQYERTLQRFTDKRRAGVTRNRLSPSLSRRQRAVATALGARVIWIVAPTVMDPPDLRDSRIRESENLLRFDDPGRYPELYAVENRTDENHLNLRGARLFTRLLAQRLAELLPPDR